MRLGEFFILGFRGPQLPKWLYDFEKDWGLGGVILFDYDVQTKTYENNIHSPAQLRTLCSEISSLSSKPLIMVDQEGGKVRRLKESKGFAPLPSAQNFAALSSNEKHDLCLKSFQELKNLGIHTNLAPVLDINYNPQNPDIGGVQRSFSADANIVRENAKIINKAALEAGIMLCAKHYPGLGGARVNSHEELTDISDSLTEEQLNLFYEITPQLPGNSLLVSHGIVKQWDNQWPTSVSRAALSALRHKLPDTLFLSDDFQMQGLQKRLTSEEACVQGLKAGLDLVMWGNNLLPEEGHASQWCITLDQAIQNDPNLFQQMQESFERIQVRKRI